MYEAKPARMAGGCVLLALMAGAAAAGTHDATQTDWCGGPGEAGPMTTWETGFDACENVSWLALAGQVALGSEPLATPQQHLIASGHPVAFGVHPVDIDRDGDLDVIGGAGEAQKVLLWYNDGQSPPGWIEQVVDAAFPGASGVHAADIDGDQDLDIVAAAESPGHRVAWWRNDGGTPIVWARQPIEESFLVSCSVTTADVNLDGRTDVLATSWSLNDVAWWRNDGGDPVAWTKQTIDSNFPGAHDAYAADIDDDGDVDIVSAGGVANRIVWFRNDGGDPIAWQRLPIGLSFTGARAAQAADIDRDGRLDVVATAFDSHVSWWRNQGGDPPAWTRQDIDSTFNGGHCVWTGDLDGDGWLDVMATAYYDNTVSWYRNTGGDPVGWEEHELATDFLNPMNVRAGDLDGDGDLDVVASSRQLGEFAWWEAAQFLAAGELRGAILDLQETPSSAELDWTARQAAGTSLSFRVRASDDPLDLGLWSDPITAPGPLSAAGRYMQYQVELATADAAVSPVLQDVVLRWSPSSDAPEHPHAAREGRLLLRAANPAAAGVSVDLELFEPSRVHVALFDPAGRQVATLADGNLAAGRHCLHAKGLGSGVFLCRARIGRVTLCERMAVVR